MQAPRVIAFDADDTLWHNEVIFDRVHKRYCDLLAHYHEAATVERTLFATEMRNLELYGYGAKGFTLSAIETAIELTQGAISADEIRTLLHLGREMLSHPVELLDHVTSTLDALAPGHELWLITKGDLRDQERKLARSGLAPRFRVFEVVSDKTAAVYADLLRRHGVEPAEFLMVGNSLKSDIIPVLALGAAAVHVPYPLTWEHERTTEKPVAPGRLFELAHLGELPALLSTRA
ncbi:MAG: HAD family hydrolase [Opitutales bacterium]